MFDLSKFLKDDVLSDYVNKPIKIKGKEVLEGVSEKYTVVVYNDITIAVIKKEK